MSDKIIDLTKLLTTQKEIGLSEYAHNLFAGIDPEIANELVTFILNYALAEVRVGLGLEDVDEDVDLKIFNKVNELYKEAAGGCYFCSNETDPNEQRFDAATTLCVMCQLKLSKVIDHLKRREIRKATRR